MIADLERQIAAQQALVNSLRESGQSTRRAAGVLFELHQKADRQRDYLRVLRENTVVASR